MMRVLLVIGFLCLLAGTLGSARRRRRDQERAGRNIDILRWVGATGTRRVRAPAPHRSLETPRQLPWSTKTGKPLEVNCEHEEEVQLRLARCRCGGRYQKTRRTAVLGVHRRRLDVIESRCTSCGRTRNFRFDPGAAGDASPEQCPAPTRPSKLMDLLGWLRFAEGLERSLPPQADAVRGQALRELDFAIRQALLFYEKGSSILRKGALFNHPELTDPTLVSLPTRAELETRQRQIREEMSRLVH